MLMLFATSIVLFISTGFAGRASTKTSGFLGATDFGDWGPIWDCKAPHLIRGFRAKMETGKDWDADHTAMNAVEFLCENERPQDVGAVGSRASKVGAYGAWTKWYFCPNGYIITGVHVLSESNQGKGLGSSPYSGKAKRTKDDTAINTVYFQCSPKYGDIIPPKKQGQQGRLDEDLCSASTKPGHACLLNHKVTKAQWVNGGDNEKYKWKGNGNGGFFDSYAEFKCDGRNGFMGFKAKVEGPQGGSEDDTALNQLQFRCGSRPSCQVLKLENLQENTRIKKDNNGKHVVKKDNNGKNVVQVEPTGQKGISADLSKPIVKPTAVLSTTNNCFDSSRTPWSHTVEDSRMLDTQESYSFSKTFQQSFSSSLSSTMNIGTKVGLSWGVGEIAKGEFYVQLSKTRTKTSAWSTSAQTTQHKLTSKRKVEARGFKTEWKGFVPPYKKHQMSIKSVGYKGSMHFTVDAVCYDKEPTEGGIVVERAKMEGTWEAVGYRHEEMVMTDVTNEKSPLGCPKPGEAGYPKKQACDCANVYSKHLEGKKCTQAAGLTKNRKKAGSKIAGSGPGKVGEHYWCYVRRGVCTAALSGQIDSVTDNGLQNMNAANPSDFEWSNQPCKTQADLQKRGIFKPSAKRRLDPALMRPAVVAALQEPVEEELIAADAPTIVRRLANPTPAPTTWLEAPGIPKFWPDYEMELCTCNEPLESNKITCLFRGEKTCPQNKPVCHTVEPVWGDEWETLCKKADS